MKWAPPRLFVCFLASRSFEQTFESAEISQTEFNEMKKLTSVNTSVNERLKELMIERDLALQDSRDLLNGMQVD